METNDVFIALGSNVGESSQTLLKAWRLLAEYDTIQLTALAPPFITAPVGMDSSSWFTNSVGQLSTSLTPHALLAVLLDIELRLGRVRNGENIGYQDRSIDLDLIYFGTVIMEDEVLILPHPRLYERLFVLEPLFTIAPQFVDPCCLQSVADMRLELLNNIRNNSLGHQDINMSSWPGTAL